MNLLKAENLGVKINGKTIILNLDLTINKGTQLLVTGSSGTGKTTLLHALAGTQFHSGAVTKDPGLKMVLVEQQHRFRNLSNTSNFYYQQRFNSGDTLDAETVRENLDHQVGEAASKQESAKILETLQIAHLLETRLIQLSNGENKRLQLAKALLLHPDILLLDNPFVGLDIAARANLETILENLIDQGAHLVMSTSGNYVPAFITDVISLSQTNIPRQVPAEVFKNQQQTAVVLSGAPILDLEGLITESREHFEFAIRMVDVNIRYENRQILDGISWDVRKGERWAVSGHNGSGKSTLLSLVNADNPQAYANQVFLFDRRRGTGESIWDIKKKIGFVSPELHLFFDAGMSSMEVVASGLFDTIGLFRVLNAEQTVRVNRWLELLKLQHLREKMFSRVSTGEQRLLLLARALVKDPPVLILDEPCQGLDDEQIARFRFLVNEIVVRGLKTLLYVSHYAQEIPPCVDKFLVLKEGIRIQ